LLTDAFFRRYEDVPLFPSYIEPLRRLLGQAAQIITEELFVRNAVKHKEEKDDPSSKGMSFAHKKLARELGIDHLVNGWYNHSWKAPNGNTMSQNYPRSIEMQTKLYLNTAPTENSSVELYAKFRISLIELCLQERQNQLEFKRIMLEANLANGGDAFRLYNSLQIGGTTWQSKEKGEIERGLLVFNNAVNELNERFRQAKVPLSYHNGFIQVSDDALLETQIERPFWSIVAQPKWQNVDQLIKEAIDKRDRSERDAVTPAMQALESVIKIISDDKGWTTGNERGAVNYINNLVAERDGVRFIEVWEKDALTDLFGKIRNHFGHGPGSQPLPTLRPQQTDWAIDTAMVWIKSLVRRT
jgi:hypothetical protein